MTTVIIGAGCAGLSLACELISAKAKGEPIEIIESRPQLDADRTWCAWRMEGHSFEDCVSASWNAWRVRTGAREVLRRSHLHPYQHIASSSFYDAAQSRLASSRASLSFGEQVVEVRAEGDRALVRTTRRELVAKRVFDSRPTGASRGDAPLLLQHFEGWEVATERPVFEPEIATLMDFEVPQDRGICFVYVLPFSTHRALVEVTYFTPDQVPIYGPILEGWLADKGPYEILRKERGVIPMTTQIPVDSGSPVVRIGLGSGAARPSTGYAFQFIQRQARALARGDQDGVHPLRHQLLDDIFLRYLLEAPQAAPTLFLRLFERNSAERLARFLSESSTHREELAIMRSLPIWPFVRAAATSDWSHLYRLVRSAYRRSA